MKTSYIYILSNYTRTVLYIGVTNNLETRIDQHKNGEGCNFTKKYKCLYLLYYEEFSDISEAINREKQLKGWHRAWKINLIKSRNPELKDLSSEFE